MTPKKISFDDIINQHQDFIESVNNNISRFYIEKKNNMDTELKTHGIYIIKAKLITTKTNIKELKKTIKDKRKAIAKCSMLNKNLKEIKTKNEYYCIYVGKVTSKKESIKGRLEEHLKKCKDGTWSLRYWEHLDEIFESTPKILYIPINNNDTLQTNLINALENIIWDKEKPIFGKK